MIATAVERLARWGLLRIGVYNLLALSLIATSAILAGYGFSKVVQGISFAFITTLMLAGMILAWFLTPRLKKPLHLGLALLFSGLLVLFLSLPGTLPVISEIAISFSNRLLQGRPWRQNWAPLISALSNLGFLAANFASRPLSWLSNGVRSGFESDPYVVRIIWGSAVWGVAAWSSVCFRKTRRGLVALAPLGLLLATTINYVRKEADILIPFAGVALLLMAVGEAGKLRSAWERQGKDYSDELFLDTGAFAVFFSAALALFAWIAPSISVRQVAQAALDVMRPRAESAQPFAESIGLEPGASVLHDQSNVRFAGLPRRHLIGSGVELDERVVMVITTGELPPMTAEQLPAGGAPRYYWKSISYNQYLGTGWQTGSTVESERAPGEQLVSAEPANSRQMTQHVTGLENLNQILYAAGTPISADARTSVFWRFGSAQDGPADLFTIHINANDYRVTSSLPEVGSLALENTSTQYPNWIRDTYLQLPENLPRRVYTLATSLTQDQDTVYAKAKAIEAYLRGFEYSLDLPEPPGDRDIVDYFLFTLRRGYCDYYASSMVVLARAAGIPSRLAVGYASGSYDPSGARYIVTAADAHSWPEIYFPEFGWIEFEPTGGQAPLDRQPLAPAFELPPNFQEGDPRQPVLSGRLPRWSRQIAWSAGFGALVILILGLPVLIDRLRLRSISAEQMIARLYRRVQKSATRVTVPPRASDTPSEFAARLARGLEKLKLPPKISPLITPIAKELALLVDVYNRAVYSPYTPREADKVRLIRVWDRMRLRLWLARIFRWLLRRQAE